MADFRVEGEATLDVSDVSRGFLSMLNDIKRVDREISKLSKDLDKLSAKDVDVAVNIDMPTEDFQMLNRELEDLDGRTIDVTVDVDAGVAVAELEEVQHLADSLDRDSINIDVDVDGFKEIEAGAMRAQSAVGTGGAGGGGLIGSLILLGTALIPLTGVAVGLSAGIVGSFATAGVGVGAFAAFAIPTIKKVIDTSTELQKVSEKIKSADTAEELTKALQEQKAILDGLSPAMLGAITNLKKFKDEYAALQAKLEVPVLKIFSSGLQLLTSVLKLAFPAAESAAKGIQNILDLANQGIKGDSWVSFFKYISDNAEYFITTWGHAVGNFLTGVANMIKAFDPLSKFVSGGLLDMSEDFLNWSKNLESNQGWQKFVNYVITNTPKAWQLIKQVGTVIWELIKALEPVGQQVITVVTDVMTMANAFKQAHPELAKLAVQAGVVIVALAPFLGMLTSVVGGVLGAARAIGGGLLPIIARFAPMLLPIAGPLGIIVAALLGIGTVLAFTNPKAQEAGGLFSILRDVWDKVVQTGKDIWSMLQVMWQTLKDTGAIDQFTSAFGHIFHALGALLPILKVAAYLITGVLVIALTILGYALNGIATVVDIVASAIGFAVGKIVDFFVWVYNKLVGHSIIPDLINGIMNWFKKIPGFIAGWAKDLVGKVTGALKNLVSSAVNLATQIKDAIVNRFNTAKSNTIAAFNLVKDKVGGALKGMFDSVVSWIGKALAIFQNLPGNIMQKIGNLGRLLWDAGGKIISGLIDGIKGKLGDLGNTLGNVGSFIKDHKGPPSEDKIMLFDAGQMIMGGLIGGIESRKSALEKALKAISTTIGNAALPKLGGTIGVTSTGGATLNRGTQAAVAGTSSHIGLYVAPGAINVSGGNGSDGQEILSKLTRISRFGQFSRPS